MEGQSFGRSPAGGAVLGIEQTALTKHTLLAPGPFLGIKSCINFLMLTAFISPFYRQGNRNSEMLNNLPKVMHLLLSERTHDNEASAIRGPTK